MCVPLSMGLYLVMRDGYSVVEILGCRSNNPFPQSWSLWTKYYVNYVGGAQSYSRQMWIANHGYFSVAVPWSGTQTAKGSIGVQVCRDNNDFIKQFYKTLILVFCNFRNIDNEPSLGIVIVLTCSVSIYIYTRVYVYIYSCNHNNFEMYC